jgi:hypothetical protein
VKVHYDEGVANHIGPKPCAVVRKGGSEASAGECIGQPLSLERYSSREADALRRVEGNMTTCDIASTAVSRRGQRPWHVQTLLVREPGDPSFGHRPIAAVVRIGKARSRSR